MVAIRPGLGIFFAFVPCGLLGFVRLLLPLVLPVPFAIVFTRHCQRIGTAAVVGLTFGMLYVAGFISTTAYFAPGSLGLAQWRNVAEWAAASLGVGIACALGNCVMCVFVRVFFFQIVEQDGTRCWRCGYIVGDPPVSTRCPECGTTTHPPTSRPSPFRRLLSRARQKRWYVIAAAILLIIMTPQLFINTSSTRGFRATLGRGQDVFAAALLDVQRQPSGLVIGFGSGEAIAVKRSIQSDPTKALLIVFDERDREDLPTLQLQLMAVVPGPVGIDYGDPLVVCNFDDEQAAFVFENDIPPSLVDAMVEAANNAGWKGVGTPGQFGELILIDPAEHLRQPP